MKKELTNSVGCDHFMTLEKMAQGNTIFFWDSLEESSEKMWGQWMALSSAWHGVSQEQAGGDMKSVETGRCERLQRKSSQDLEIKS